MSDRDYMAVVRDLLAKAESTPYPEEADAFLGKAQELMATHAIDEAMITHDGRSERGDVETRTIVCVAPYAAAKSRLLGGIAKANDCKAIRLNSGANQTHMVFGFPQDLDHVEAMYTSLSLQAVQALLAEADQSRSFKRSFLVGFADRVGARLASARQQAEQAYERDHDRGPGEPGVAVVLADKRSAVDDAFRTAFPETRTLKTKVSSTSGALAGHRAGERADLGNPHLGGTRRAIQG